MTTVAWSTTLPPADPPDLGTAPAPTAFTDVDFIYGIFTCNGVPVTRPIPVRRAPGAFAPLVDQTFTENTGLQTYTFAAATGTGLTWTYSLISPPAGVTLFGRTVTVDTTILGLQVTTITVRASDQYPRSINGDFVLTIEAEVFAPPGVWETSGGDGSITITLQPAQPAQPTTLGGDGSIIITG